MKFDERKPAIYIYEEAANPAGISEICAGLEEEGIPWFVFKKIGNAKKLAFDAAQHSKLGIGIGVTSDTTVLQIKNCSINKPVYMIEVGTENCTSQLRNLGQNAARAIKGGVFV